MDSQTNSLRQSEEDRRNFLKSCGRFAATVPPAMTVMLSTSLTSKAIAKSTGAGDGGGGNSDTGTKGQGGVGYSDAGTKGQGDSGKKRGG